MIRYLILACLLSLPLSGQTFDPDPNEPYAASVAEHRYLIHIFYGGPPPLGWICTADLVEVETGLWLPDALCWPDPEALRRQRDDALAQRRAAREAVRPHRGRR